ncbi:MAG: hypothetical protein ABI431_09915 [Candidatus Tumulicola sp.]
MRRSIGFRLMLLASLALMTLGANDGESSKPFPPALADMLVRDPDVAPCAQNAHAASNAAYASANFDFSRVKLTGGAQMIVVTGGGSCVCGNANCKVVVFEQTGDAYKSVLSDYGIDWKVRPDGTAVVTSHDSAAVVFRTSYRWNGKAYTVSATDMVYVPSNVAKPARRNITFAPGASSTVIRGDKLTLGFEDEWSFSARAGQTLTLTLVEHDRHFGSFSVRSDAETLGTASTGTLRVALPQSRRYEITVEGGDESFSKYALNVTIR